MKKSEELARAYKQTRKALGLNGERQQDQLRKLRELFALTNDELAAAIGVSHATLNAYMAPESSGRYRKMPAADLLIVSRIIETHKRKRK